MPGIGRPRWRVELLRCRGGVPAAGIVEVPMRRVMYVWLPSWPIDRLRRAGHAAPTRAELRRAG